MPKTSGTALRDAAEELLPGFLAWADWGSTWTRPIDSGVALEWATCAAVAAAAARAGWSCEVPLLSKEHGKVLFPLRNEVPTQHNAQAGHSASLRHRVPMVDRFVGAMIPKIELAFGAKRLSLFREGCPYHAIMTDKVYDERPDIVIVAGHLSEGFPWVELRGSSEVVHFSFDIDGVGTAAGELQVRNAPWIPCAVRRPENGCDVPARAVIECGVQKTAMVARQQTERYRTLFSADEVVLVTGNDLSAMGLPNATVRLPGDSVSLANDLRRVGKVLVEALGMEV